MRSMTPAVLLILVLAGCGSRTYVHPYETCGGDDACSGGLACVETTLPASTGFTGAFCTSGCDYDSDCVQVPSSFEGICVNSQCYLTCPSDEACPYDQSCLTFQDQFGTLINLCTP
jgi:hypothetical protein